MLKASLEPQALLWHIAQAFSASADPPPADWAISEKIRGQIAVFRRGSDLTDPLIEASAFLVSGWACHMRPLGKGRRQIFRFLVPGDALGSYWPRRQTALVRTAALTRVETIAATSLARLEGLDGPGQSAIALASRRADEQERELLYDHIVRLGAHDAYAGLAHLLLELHDRLARVDLVEQGTFLLPIGQRVLAQAMGFSAAHINHTLHRMTADGLMVFEGTVLRLLEVDRMLALTGFRSRRDTPAFVPRGDRERSSSSS